MTLEQDATLSGEPREKARGRSIMWEQRFFDTHGKRKSKTGKTAVSARRAAQAEVDKLNHVTAPEDAETGISLADFCEQFLVDSLRGRDGKRPNSAPTVETNRSRVKLNIVPFIGDIPVNKFSAKDMRDFRRSLIDDTRITTVGAQRTLVLLKTILGYAVVEELIENIPGKDVLIQRDWAEEEEIKANRVPSDEDIAKLDAAARACATSNQIRLQNSWLRYYPLYMILRTTGCRISEALGLRWDNISDDFRSAELRQKADRVVKAQPPEERTSRLKTKNSRRTIYFGEETANALKKWREKSKDSPAHSVYVFSTRTGTIIRYENFRDKMWKPLRGSNYPGAVRHSILHAHSPSE